MKKRHTKLRLSRETLHRLVQEDLVQVVGRQETFLVPSCNCTGESYCYCRITASICKYETCDC